MTRKSKSEEFADLAQQALEHVAANGAMVSAGVERAANTPPPMALAEALHAELTRAYAALHAIGRLECVTRPEAAAEEVKMRGYHSPCRDPGCGPCLALAALIPPGRYPA